MRFEWEKNLHLEDKSKRSHTTKDFQHPTDPTKRILIQSSGLLHYFDGKEFQDLPDLPFPEGKEIKEPKSRHFIMNLPDWGEAKVEKNGKQVRVYDKLGQPIYIFKNPLVVPKGKAPYKVVNKNGKKIKETKNRKEKIDIDERIEKSDDAVEVSFEVENNKLYFKLPKGLNYPLEAYDDTDTSSTNNKDTWIRDDFPDTNNGTDTRIRAGVSETLVILRTLIHFTLSSGSGDISDVKLFLNMETNYTGGTGGYINVHELTQTAWTEDGATWNKYDGVNNWTTPGGDYDATIIDQLFFDNADPTDIYYSWVLMGTGADNPLTLNWGDNIHLLLKVDDETRASAPDIAFKSKENASDNPYLEITYAPPLIEVTCSDTISLTDAVTKTTNYFQTITETIGTSDTIQKQANYSKTISETITLSDVVNAIRGWFINVADTIHLTDSVQKFTKFTKTISETISLSDIVSSTKKFMVSVADVIHLSDAVSKAVKLVKTISDTLHISDVVSITGKFWNWITKHTTSWTNETKHTSTWTWKDKSQ